MPVNTIVSRFRSLAAEETVIIRFVISMRTLHCTSLSATTSLGCLKRPQMTRLGMQQLVHQFVSFPLKFQFGGQTISSPIQSLLSRQHERRRSYLSCNHVSRVKNNFHRVSSDRNIMCLLLRNSDVISHIFCSAARLAPERAALHEKLMASNGHNVSILMEQVLLYLVDFEHAGGRRKMPRNKRELKDHFANGYLPSYCRMRSTFVRFVLAHQRQSLSEIQHLTTMTTRK